MSNAEAGKAEKGENLEDRPEWDKSVMLKRLKKKIKVPLLKIKLPHR